jgi:hypothetical protein
VMERKMLQIFIYNKLRNFKSRPKIDYGLFSKDSIITPRYIYTG